MNTNTTTERTAITCTKCRTMLNSPMRRELPDHKIPADDVTHAQGRCFVVRKPMGYEVIGECMRCGLVRNVPFGLPNTVEMG